MKKIITSVLVAVFAVVGFLGATAQASSLKTVNQNKVLVQNFWNELFNKHNTKVIDTLVGSEYKQHNPGFPDGKDNFKTAISRFLVEFPNSKATIKHIGADGDLVYIHNHIQLNDADRGQAAVDIFRVKNGKIVEHWDVIQDIPETAENNNTMF